MVLNFEEELIAVETDPHGRNINLCLPRDVCKPLLDDAVSGDFHGWVNSLLDAIFLLNWQFNSGDAPPSPGTEECGEEEDDDDDMECGEDTCKP